MSLFDNMLKGSESLFVDEIALDFDYIPKVLKCRENEQQYIATCIKPLFQGRNGKNLLIIGSPGIGKTCATKWVLRELENETNDIISIYVNCWKKDTPYKIILDICEQLGYKWVQEKKTDELIKSILPILNKKSVVFVFDEIDKLHDFQILYTLLEDTYKKTIILITNEEPFISNLDSRIKSRLLPEKLNFHSYNLDETKKILKQRMEYAFVKDIFESEILNLIANKSFELSDIRTGLYLMKESALIAEEESSKKITIKHAEEAIKKLKDFKIKKSTDLSDSEKEILEFLKINSGKSIKEIFALYEEKGQKMTYRNFFRKIKHLEKSRFIALEDIPNKSSIVTYGVKKLTDF